MAQPSIPKRTTRNIAIALIVISILIISVAAETVLSTAPKSKKFAFDISTDVANGVLQKGQSLQTNVDVELVSGNPENVSLSVDSGSSEIQCNLSKTSGIPTFNCTLTINAPESIAANNYSLTIIGTGGGVTNSTTLNIIVLNGASGAVVANSNVTLAQQINGCLNAVTNWTNLVNIGVVMHKSSPIDFDTWITRRANASDWIGVLLVKRYAVEAGYSSPTIDNAVKLALTNIPMFTNYSLPLTEGGYFWPSDTYALYGYQYAQQLNWETNRWNITSGFEALNFLRNAYGNAFYACNPDTPAALSLYGSRWHEVGCLMDCFFVFYTLGVPQALQLLSWGMELA